MNTIVVIETELGNIEVELFPKKAPITVKNFLINATSGLYNGGMFFRSARSNQTVNGEGIDIIEAAKDDSKNDCAPINHENTFDTGLLNKRGVLAMSRSEVHGASSGFFINIRDNPLLDSGFEKDELCKQSGYACFGLVVSGMETAYKIYQSPTGGRPPSVCEKKMIDRLIHHSPPLAEWHLRQYLNHNILIHSVYRKSQGQ